MDNYNLENGFYLANNICDLLTDEQTDHIGAMLSQQIADDIQSRSGWLAQNDDWMKLVTQVVEEKTYPWKGASNIKFPLISTAAVQFHARSFPALLGGNRPVKFRVFGKDPGNVKAFRAERLSVFHSYQLLEGMEDWIGDMDRLLFILPIIGSLYKKTYYDEAKRSIVSDMIHPRDLIINYDALDIKEARKTHRQWKLPNKIREMQNRGLWRKLPTTEEEVIRQPKQHSEPRDAAQGLNNPGKADEFSLQEIYEVHCLLDLDDDGYMEPYVVTMRADSSEVYRIVANYDDGDMEMDGEDIIAITPKDYFTHYFFLPDPESKTHGLGFGTMVGPINDAVNTLINILTDSGHMHSLGAGWLARGVRLKGGASGFRPNEWKQINTTGDDLRKGIMPLPTKEPSTVLFQLLGMLIDSGKDLASVQDLMVGRNPGQNQPYSTTQAVMEQGMKVFNGIYKRIYRSMTYEFKKIYALNQQFPDIRTYMEVLDDDGMDIKAAAEMPSPETGKPRGMAGVIEYLSKDFSSRDLAVLPTAEPDMVAEMQKIARANALLEKLQQGIPLNVSEVTKRVLEAEGHENIPELMEVPPPSMPPEVQLEREKFEHQKNIDSLKMRSQQLLDMAEVGKRQVETQVLLAEKAQLEVKDIHQQYMEEQRLIKDEYDSVTKRIEAIIRGQAGEAAKQDSGSAGNSDTRGS